MSKPQFLGFVLLTAAAMAVAYFVSGPIVARDVDYLINYWGKP